MAHSKIIVTISILLCLIFVQENCLFAYEDYIVVERGNVAHVFVATHVEWIDHFLEINFPEWENDTFAIFEMVKDPQGIAIDLGAWLGTTAIWLSKNFAYVVAVEADRDSVHYLEKNIRASDCQNVAICNKAVADCDKLVTLDLGFQCFMVMH